LVSLRNLPFEDLKVCKHDTHRVLRNGFSETILCEGKSADHIVHIVKSLIEKKMNILATRLDKKVAERIKASVEDAGIIDYHLLSRTLIVRSMGIEKITGRIGVLCAGTADMSVADEASRTAEFFGASVEKYYDIGVAGIHRLTSCLEKLQTLDCAIVVAGMEGALPSVVGGLIPCPIIGVPTSIGYGANLKGFSALLCMLNSCSEGVVVVNIDNGFGAACSTIRILKSLLHKK